MVTHSCVTTLKKCQFLAVTLDFAARLGTDTCSLRPGQHFCPFDVTLDAFVSGRWLVDLWGSQKKAK